MTIEEKIMQLKSKETGQLIGNIPVSRSKTVDECIEYLGGKIISHTNDPLWSANGGNVIIRGNLYDYDELTIVERAIGNDRINYIVGDTCYYPNADSFVCDCTLGLDYMDLEATKPDMVLIEQLRILWHVVQDPFKLLLEKLDMTQADCAVRFCVPLDTLQEWLRGETPAPTYVRLMMAEAVGVLTIRNLA